MCRKIKRAALAALCLLATLVAAAALTACKQKYNPKTDIPGINSNAVLNIERTELSFALDMDIDPIDVVVRCGCVLTDDEGHEVPVTRKHITDGAVKFTPFELDEAGANKMITVSYKDAANYIFYDVTEYKAEFYLDGQTKWKSEPASSALNAELDLSVWVDLSDYNYSIDATARKNDLYHAERFDGWNSDTGSAVTGNVAMKVTSAVESTVEFSARYITDAQFDALELSYDARGRRVFSGYKGGDTDCVYVPEGVTFVDIDAVFYAAPDATPVNFASLDIPSTAMMELPRQYRVNTRGLESITVDAGNPYYESYGGAVYSENLKKLYLMPASNGTVEFPDDLEEFEKYSCAYWEVMKFALPDSVHTLHDYCFAYSDLIEVIGIDRVKNVMSGVLWGSRVPMTVSGGGYYTELNGKYTLSSVDKNVTEFTVLPGTVAIAGNAFSGCEKLVSVDLGGELESIGEYAFMGCTKLAEIALPNTVCNIDEYAFYGCSSLETVNGFENVDFSENENLKYAVPRYIFAECTELKNIELPLSVETVGAYAFRDCTSLTSIDLHNVKEIDTGAFYYCGLTSVTFPETLETLGVNTFMGSKLESVDLSKCTKLTSLPSRSFQQTKLVDVTIPEHITEIGSYCFYYITTLKTVAMSDVETLESYAFGNCTKLATVDFGKALKTIGLRAFSSCALTEAVLPDTVETVGGYAFVCGSLKRLRLGASVKTFGNYAFDADGETFKTCEPVLYTADKLEVIEVSEFNENFKIDCGALYGRSVCGNDYGDYGVLYFMPPMVRGMTEFTDHVDTKVILPYAFQGQSSLTDVNFTAGVINIGKVTFYASTSLERVRIPSTTAHIGVNILLDCAKEVEVILSEDNTNIKFIDNIMYLGTTALLGNAASGEVHIEPGTTVIAAGTFMDNTKITKVYIPDSVTQIDDKAFGNCTGLELLSIGAGLNKLNGTPFQRLPSLKRIEVSPNNKAFKTVYENMLYSADGKTLVLCAAANGITDLSKMLDTVVTVGNYAFSDHKTLRTVELPEGVKTIGNYAFYECRALETLYTSYSLQSIGEYAFSFKDPVDLPDLPAGQKENRYCNTLKTVLIRDGLQSLGKYAFYGQYGIQQVFYEMNSDEIAAFWADGNINTINATYLRYGCPKGDGTYYNTQNEKGEISRYIYSRVKPDRVVAGYSWFKFDTDGKTPVPWD